MNSGGTLNVAWKTLGEAVNGNRGLAWGVWWNIALLAGSVAALPFDRRTILGLDPWVKPIKFDISVIVFLVTMAVMLAPLPEEWRQTKVWLGWCFGVAMIVENSVIALQSARGVRSHMNYTSPLNGSLFGVMGFFILLNTVCAAWLLVLWLRTDAGMPPAVAWGVRLGLLMLLAASVEGVRMVMWGGHTVGAKDGGPGLAFLNWSTGHGDLRVAHFFALHALQIFPLAGMALAKTPLRTGVQVCGLVGFAAAYGWAVCWMFAAAMRGMPILRG
jgi:hypothetical protein